MPYRYHPLNLLHFPLLPPDIPFPFPRVLCCKLQKKAISPDKLETHTHPRKKQLERENPLPPPPRPPQGSFLNPNPNPDPSCTAPPLFLLGRTAASPYPHPSPPPIPLDGDDDAPPLLLLLRLLDYNPANFKAAAKAASMFSSLSPVPCARGALPPLRPPPAASTTAVTHATGSRLAPSLGTPA